jgi:hypothetical protein
MVMATDVQTTNEPSLVELVTGIVNDGQTLLKQQFQMFKHEIKEDVHKAKDGSIMLGIGAGIGLVGAILWAMTLSLLLNTLVPTLPLWACYAIWGAVFVIVAVGLALAGKARLESVNPLEDETAQTVKENVEWLTKPK